MVEVPTTAIRCRHAFGTYNYGAGVCTEMQVAYSVCVKVARAGVGEDAHWVPDRSGGGFGCEAQDGWAPVFYDRNDGSL